MIMLNDENAFDGGKNCRLEAGTELTLCRAEYPAAADVADECAVFYFTDKDGVHIGGCHLDEAAARLWAESHGYSCGECVDRPVELHAESLERRIIF